MIYLDFRFSNEDSSPFSINANSPFPDSKIYTSQGGPSIVIVIGIIIGKGDIIQSCGADLRLIRDP